MKLQSFVFKNTEEHLSGFVFSCLYRNPKPCYMLSLYFYYFRIVVTLRWSRLGLSRVRPSDNLESI